MPSTSGSTAFNMDLNTLAEEAFERCGTELRTGYDLRTAARSLNLLTIEWANRGINLWTMEGGEFPLVKGVGNYPLPVDTIDLIEQFLRTGTGTSQTDLSITRISNSTYVTIPNKLVEGRPVQMRVIRRTGAEYPVPQDVGGQLNPNVANAFVTVWPTPDRNDYYILRYWRLRRIQDAGSGVNVPDIPFRFLPALVAGLAYHLAKKLPGGMERIQFLKEEYEEAFQAAADEDREKSTLRIVPRSMFI